MNKKALILHALKAAKGYLSPTFLPYSRLSYKEQFICLALDSAARSGKTSRKGSELAEAMIMDRLEGCYTAHRWLTEMIGKKALDAAPMNAIQQWRHRWLDSLIEEFSK